MKSVIMIPARFKSSRFPGKPLVSLLGKPMILWVAELCSKALEREDVYVATDDRRIHDVVTAAGFKAVMTGDDAPTGTDRLAEAATKIDADIYINVQGDEPLLDPEDIRKVIGYKEQYPEEIINGYCALGPLEDPNDVNIPKVVFSESGRLLYMSRRAVPGYKADGNRPTEYYKQVCIYAFSKKELMMFRSFNRKSAIEKHEDIEILRFLEWNQPIRMVRTKGASYAVDVPEDVGKVEKAMLERRK
jgi:3-deoxy-manno-octulosonate cytidylyltransferase (CMP-KDO synthetase)